jgi:hypothetical protein
VINRPTPLVPSLKRGALDIPTRCASDMNGSPAIGRFDHEAGVRPREKVMISLVGRLGRFRGTLRLRLREAEFDRSVRTEPATYELAHFEELELKNGKLRRTAMGC